LHSGFEFKAAFLLLFRSLLNLCWHIWHVTLKAPPFIYIIITKVILLSFQYLPLPYIIKTEFYFSRSEI